MFLFKKRKTIVEFCKSNLDRHLNTTNKKLLEDIEEKSNYQLKEFSCLSHCEECSKSCVAIVNKNIFKADNLDHLLKKISNQKP